MSKYAHVVKTAGHLINAGLLEKMVSNHRYCYGIAVAKDDSIMLKHMKDAPSVDVLLKVQEAFKDNAAVFAFGDIKEVLEEDIQPISILRNADGDPVCVVCLDGDYDRHRKANESHSPEYLVAKNNLEKRIKRYADKGMGPAEIIAELNDELTKDDIGNLSGERGSVTFLFSDGQVCTIISGEAHRAKYSWGFASESYGYLENTGETHKASVVDKGKNLLASLMTGKSDNKAAAPQGGTVVSAAIQPPQTETALPPILETLPEGTGLVKPDFQHYDTRKKQKAWYESRLGYEPQQFKSAPPLLKIPSKDGQITWKMSDSKSLGILAHSIEWDPPRDAASKVEKTEEKPDIQQQVAEKIAEKVEKKSEAETVVAPAWLQSKKSSPKEVGGSQSKTIAQQSLPAGGNDKARQSVPASVRTDRLPQLPPDQIQKVQEIMKKSELVGLFGENMKQIIDPKTLKQQVEQELPDFAKRFGLGENMDVFDGWSYEQFFLFAQSLLTIGKPDVIAKMMFDLRNNSLRHKLSKLTNPNQRIAI